jgi:prephenate dehydratase
MKVAFQGVHGAYSEVAAKKLLGLSCQTYPLETFERVFESVEKAHVERGIIPIENSLAGSIHQNYDLLLSRRLHIVGETYMRIEHALSCHPASSLPQLKYVRSHPQALAQCSRFFARHKKLTPVAYFDTAGAAKSLVENRTIDTGAIASAYAARLYGLTVLKNNVEDQPNNYTRFLVISRKPWRPRTGTASKSSIAFIPKRNEVGVLFKILGVFSLRSIDLLKIESRPNPQSPFEYLFYLDLLGSSNEKQVARAFDHLQEMVMNFRLLGSYPLGKGRFHASKK